MKKNIPFNKCNMHAEILRPADMKFQLFIQITYVRNFFLNQIPFQGLTNCYTHPIELNKRYAECKIVYA